MPDKEQVEQNREHIVTLCSQITRPGITDLMKWLDSSDFYTAPASTRFHGAEPGGLAAHSIAVYLELNRTAAAWKEFFPENLPEESLIITGLFHDLCKVNCYKAETRRRKNDTTGVWESYETYTRDEKFPFGGHGSKSVFIIQNYMKLTPEEAVAINCHMGAYDDPDGKYVSAAYEHYPLAWALHVADEAATFLNGI